MHSYRARIPPLIMATVWRSYRARIQLKLSVVSDESEDNLKEPCKDPNYEKQYIATLYSSSLNCGFNLHQVHQQH